MTFATIRSIDGHAARASAKTIWVFVHVRDSDGNSGWGEATLAGQEGDLAAALSPLAAQLCGTSAHPCDNPLDRCGVRRTDRAGAAIASALDQALWDAAGRREGRPMRDLIGTTVRDTIPLYANINRRTVDRTPAGFAASARKAIADGFETVKIAPFDAVRPGSGENVAEGIARAAAVRSEIGPTRRLFVDCHWRFDLANASIALDALAELGVTWFECPLPEHPENFEGLRQLRAQANRLGAVLAGCETETALEGFRPFIDAGTYDVLMPDIKYAGGMVEFRRTADYAATRGMKVAPHNPSGPVSHVASLQLCATLPGMMILEHQYDESPVFSSILLDSLPLTHQGNSALPAGPGLGISLDAGKLISLSELRGPSA
jgi:galactonate dehydratase